MEQLAHTPTCRSSVQSSWRFNVLVVTCAIAEVIPHSHGGRSTNAQNQVASAHPSSRRRSMATSDTQSLVVIKSCFLAPTWSEALAKIACAPPVRGELGRSSLQLYQTLRRRARRLGSSSLCDKTDARAVPLLVTRFASSAFLALSSFRLVTKHKWVGQINTAHRPASHERRVRNTSLRHESVDFACSGESILFAFIIRVDERTSVMRMTWF